MGSVGKSYIHPSAIIENGVELGENCKIWHFCHVREGAKVEANASLGGHVYIDHDVVVGANSRIQNGVSVYAGINIAPWTFIGPHVVFTNDIAPRAGLKSWDCIPTELRTGCAIGAGSVIRCGITLGEFCLVGAGAIVTKSVMPFHLAIGFPAYEKSKVCACGKTMLPLDADKREHIQSCCEKRLHDDLLKVAQEVIEGLK